MPHVESQSSSRPVIAVLGATGAQGGGLARAILADPRGQFALRALTRKPDSPAARALRDAGADIVAADLDDAASVKRAMQGAYGAFCVTNFWEHFSPERELAQAHRLAQAAADVGVKHVVWSTLEDTREYVPAGSGAMPVLMGKYNVPHFDGKGEANRAFLDRKVPTTLLYTSFYWDNLIHFGMQPKRGADGRLKFVLPMDDAKLPGIAAADIGACAFGIFERGERLIGKSCGIAGEHLSGADMAQALAEALGEPVDHVAMSPERYRALGFPGAEDLGNMFQFKRDFERTYRASRSVDCSRDLNPNLLSFRAWLAQNASRIPVE